MVLAAGEGRRLRPVTERLPKPMVPLGGRPLLEYNIRWLARYGIRDLVVNLHYCPEVIPAYFGDGAAFGVRMTYSYEAELLGTAGAIRRVAHLFAGGTFLIIYGDNLSNCNLGRLLTLHRDKAGLCTVAVFHRDDVTHSGMVVLDEHDRIACFVEKPTASEAFSNWVNAGIIVAEPALLDYIPQTGLSDIGRDVLPAALSAGNRLYGYRMSENLWWVDSLEEYQDLARRVAMGEVVL